MVQKKHIYIEQGQLLTRPEQNQPDRPAESRAHQAKPKSNMVNISHDAYNLNCQKNEMQTGQTKRNDKHLYK